ncbi:MAG: hypothetical protein EXR33_10835 [Betaproteobacteria bacterium]|nr:hypothetical protein [Betaproteobacteria bacterium]
MKARLLYEFKQRYDDGATIEIVLWELPQPVASSAHRYKYRLFYGFPGRRIVGYDNESGKGDHRHAGASELSYAFVSPESLIEDFLADVRQRRRK